uniref:Uncharacterized protein n=1 Tax=Candidatus Kentrum sp. FM TaxID=2126340 RepID=A0A450W1L3_9GAMM|nr:MAG: hypothetical protein BECKFM1743C_GA0114222_107781 [Candidatus Kentron sp. FM]VFJ75226.1 MAG: hypothetical protein BECKFM1743A_GA0114220_108182 [Candidatus Kentron sp. FM]VFK10892.1 MAG: hypothetical protein BECKFM1743B_GA0114221_101591 [Candidatus Kentron sp. FM]
MQGVHSQNMTRMDKRVEMDKKSPFLAQFLARMSVFERENSTFLLVFHPVSADVIFWECTQLQAQVKHLEESKERQEVAEQERGKKNGFR